MSSTLRVRDLIINGESEDKTFYAVIAKGGANDMQTFDQHLLQLFQKGLITEEAAMTHSSHRNDGSCAVSTPSRRQWERRPQISKD